MNEIPHEQIIRNAEACLADPDAPLQAKAWAKVAKLYAKQAMQDESKETPYTVDL